MSKYVYHLWCSKHDHEFYAIFYEPLKEFDSEFIMRLNGPYCEFNATFVRKGKNIKIVSDGKEVHSKVVKLKIPVNIKI